jgi:hypothetical protein
MPDDTYKVSITVILASDVSEQRAAETFSTTLVPTVEDLDRDPGRMAAHLAEQLLGLRINAKHWVDGLDDFQTPKMQAPSGTVLVTVDVTFGGQPKSFRMEVTADSPLFPIAKSLISTVGGEASDWLKGQQKRTPVQAPEPVKMREPAFGGPVLGAGVAMRMADPADRVERAVAAGHAAAHFWMTGLLTAALIGMLALFLSHRAPLGDLIAPGVAILVLLHTTMVVYNIASQAAARRRR